MTQPIPTKIKARDIAIGFFGLVIFHNLFFILYLSIGLSIFGLADVALIPLGLPIIIALLIVIAKKRIWIGAGVATSILITFGIWIYIYFSAWGDLEICGWSLFSFLLAPFPRGVYLCMS